MNKDKPLQYDVKNAFLSEDLEEEVYMSHFDLKLCLIIGFASFKSLCMG